MRLVAPKTVPSSQLLSSGEQRNRLAGALGPPSVQDVDDSVGLGDGAHRPEPPCHDADWRNAAYREREWRREHKGLGVYPEEHLWRATHGYLDLLAATRAAGST